MVRTAAYTTSLKQQTQPVCGASDGGVSGPYACAARLRQVATERMAARCCRRTVKKGNQAPLDAPRGRTMRHSW